MEPCHWIDCHKAVCHFIDCLIKNYSIKNYVEDIDIRLALVREIVK